MNKNENFSGIHGETLNRQMMELLGVYSDAIKLLRISDTEFWIWYTLLTMEGEHTQQEICHMWSLRKQTVNTVITRLRLKKFISLEIIPHTRNHKIIRLTEAGKSYGQNLILPITQAQEKAFAKISPDELSLAIGILENYITTVKGALDATVPPCEKFDVKNKRC